MRIFISTILLTMLAFMVPGDVRAQVKDNPVSLGIGLSAVDFSGPITKDYFSFNEYHGVGRAFLGLYLNRSFNMKLDFSGGDVWHPRVLAYPDVEQGIYKLERLYDAGLKVEYKLDNSYIFKEEAVIGPYIFAGIGGNYLGGEHIEADFNSYFPFGFGFNIRPAKFLTLNLQAEYKLNIDNSFDYMQYSGGLGFNFGGGKKEKPPALVDTDSDGIPDDTDECPFAAGVLEYFGCPDTDGDGIGDSRDRCPFDSGAAANKGCPEVDTDGDGVVDEKDQCPGVAGLVELDGCPDGDGDGVPDHLDECPEAAGTAANKGGPEQVESKEPLLQKTFSIYFDPNSSRIKKTSGDVLNDVARMLSKDPGMTLKIKGHTCDVGADEKNVDLSLKRAESAWDYLVGKGVDGQKMAVYGYGEFVPKYSNTDPQGQAKNRRVDLELMK